MNDLLHRYLDGEISLEELPEELRAQALRWDARIEMDRTRGRGGMPEGMEARIMGEIGRGPSEPAWKGVVAWLTRPRQVTVSPLGGFSAAAAVVVLAVFGSWLVGIGTGSGDLSGPAGDSPPSPDIIVEFVLEAPGAQTVSLAGDFTTWTPGIELRDPDGDGVWVGRVRMQPGVHQYMFVIDGSEWVTDPRADRYVDDGFGNRNAVLVVPGGVRS